MIICKFDRAKYRYGRRSLLSDSLFYTSQLVYAVSYSLALEIITLSRMRSMSAADTEIKLMGDNRKRKITTGPN